MTSDTDDCSAFNARFIEREQAERYRDRYRIGRRARIDSREREVLRDLLEAVGHVSVALDIPGGTGRLTSLIAEISDRVILADRSPVMLEVAREDLLAIHAEYLETDAQSISLETGSVDLVFSHRFLHHIHDGEARARVFREFARVSRRYVVVSYYTPGFRDRFRYACSRAIPGAARRDRPATVARFFEEAAAVGLVPKHVRFLRRFPLKALFCLFDHSVPTR